MEGFWTGPQECPQCLSRILVGKHAGARFDETTSDAVGLPVLHEACGELTAVELRHRFSHCFSCGGRLELPFAPLGIRVIADLLLRPYEGINYSINRQFVRETTRFDGMSELIKQEWDQEVPDELETTHDSQDITTAFFDVPTALPPEKRTELDRWAKNHGGFETIYDWLDERIRRQAEIAVLMFDHEIRNPMIPDDVQDQVNDIMDLQVIPQETIRAVKRKFFS